MLPVVWHYGVNGGYITPNEIAALMSENTARIMGLFPKKGRLDPGADADLVIFDPSAPWTVTAGNQHTSATYTLFEDVKITGRVRSVVSKGKLVVDSDEYLGREGDGKFIPTHAGQWKK